MSDPASDFDIAHKRAQKVKSTNQPKASVGKFAASVLGNTSQ
jgi:hypothetical protein